MARSRSPALRQASPSLSRCAISRGSALTSSSRALAAFSNLPFLKNSATESLSLRVSTLAIVRFLPLFRLRCLFFPLGRAAGDPDAALRIFAQRRDLGRGPARRQHLA